MAVECDLTFVEQEFPRAAEAHLLVTVLIEDLRQTVEELIRASAAGDVDTAARAAHSIAGAVGVVGASALGHCARRLELSIRAGEAGQREHLFVLQAAVAELVCALETWMGERRDRR